MFLTLRSLRNQFDFFVRSQIRFSRPVPDAFPTPACDLALQDEVKEFLKGFPFDEALARWPKGKELCVLDVGARNFSLAPMLDAFFAERGYPTRLHGIEVDGYRRMVDLRTRLDFGRYYSRKARHASFHVLDFLEWQKPADIVFLLNPFVSESPTLAWGLPLTKLKPEPIFQKAHALLAESKGLLVLSNPSEDENEISLKLAIDAGFHVIKAAQWQPSPLSKQQRPRYGHLFRLSSS